MTLHPEILAYVQSVQSVQSFVLWLQTSTHLLNQT